LEIDGIADENFRIAMEKFRLAVGERAFSLSREGEAALSKNNPFPALPH
jgi:hypothetical protein